MKLMKDAYDCTSTAVHEGKIPNRKIELLFSAAEFAKKAIVKLINEGGVDWQKLELQA
jgi:hypothetical protein